MGKIIKTEIVDNISSITGMDKNKVQKVIDCFLEEIKKDLKEGNSIELRGFGIFENKLRKEKNNAQNPKTGEKVSVPAHYVASFKAGKELKQALMDLKVEK